ncbi:hypothetical protein FOCC_FOCC008355 [Frankliniella occidentalis]|nr:hypothetical protein FOCC_FOCC008355 [Frankliniella occidentalis]
MFARPQAGPWRRMSLVTLSTSPSPSVTSYATTTFPSASSNALYLKPIDDAASARSEGGDATSTRVTVDTRARNGDEQSRSDDDRAASAAAPRPAGNAEDDADDTWLLNPTLLRPRHRLTCPPASHPRPWKPPPPPTPPPTPPPPPPPPTTAATTHAGTTGTTAAGAADDIDAMTDRLNSRLPSTVGGHPFDWSDWFNAKLTPSPPMDDDHARRDERKHRRRAVAGGAAADEEHYSDFCGDDETRALLRGAAAGPPPPPQGEEDDAGGTDFYGMGADVRKALYDTFRITRLHDWQRRVLDDHLLAGGRGRGRNGLVIAPAGGGKTLVALIMTLHALLVRHEDAMMVMPYVAVVREVADDLRLLVAKLVDRRGPTSCFTVEEYAASKGQLPPPPPTDRLDDAFKTAGVLYVCTIDKANALYRHFAKVTPPVRVGCLVLDELHVLGDDRRGGIYEELVTSVIFWAGASTRILALTATVGNDDVLATYLGGGALRRCLLHRAPHQAGRIREYAVVAGAAFPISRRPDGSGHAHFEGGGPPPTAATLSTSSATSTTSRSRDGPCAATTASHNASGSSHTKPGTTCSAPSSSRCPTGEGCSASSSRRCVACRPPSPTTASASSYTTTTMPPYASRDSGAGHVLHQPPPTAMALDDVPDPYAGRADTRLRDQDRGAWDARVVATLAADAVTTGRSVLIFCPTRAECVAMCQTITEVASDMLRQQPCTTTTTTPPPLARPWPSPSAVIEKERRHIAGHLLDETDGTVDGILLRGIRHGVAYHMAVGMSDAERTAVEAAFARRVVTVLTCTTTLAAGVNLPADRVIITTPRFGAATEFLSCIRYLQMIGRAGRTGLARADPDSYILVKPGDVARFQSLVERHVENVGSNLLKPPHYDDRQASRGTAAAVTQRHSESCLTRLIVGVISTAGRTPLSLLWDAYRATLLFQAGRRDGDATTDAFALDDDGSRRLSPLPLLNHLQAMLREGYVRVLLRADDDDGHADLRHRHAHVLLSRTDGPGLHDRTTTTDDDRHHRHRSATAAETARFVTMLDEAVAALDDDGGLLLCDPPSLRRPPTPPRLPDVILAVSGVTAAADLATLPLADATAFVDDVREWMRNALDVDTPLALLYMLIPDQLCSEKLDDDDADRIGTEFPDLDSHPHARTVHALGITTAKLDAWLTIGRVRRNARFSAKLARLWAALFANELFLRPQRFRDLCTRFGRDRAEALDLTNAVATRLLRLRDFTRALADSEDGRRVAGRGRLWCFTRLAGAIADTLTDPCEDELRPLLAIRHVSRGRARRLYDMGCRDVASVAAVYPPTRLADAIPNLGVWRAIDMVLHARTLLRDHAARLAVRAHHRYMILAARGDAAPTTTSRTINE